MDKTRNLFFIVFLLVFSRLVGQTPYEFFFKISGGARGNILLIIPYRFYYEISAAVDFSAAFREDGSLQFQFADLPKVGYMLRTTGYSGKSIVILTAHDDMTRHLAAANQVLAAFKKEASEYARRVKQAFKHPFDVISYHNPGAGFLRSADGIHHNMFNNLDLKYLGHAKNFDVYFNVFKIMTILLGVYNHSFLPAGESGQWLRKSAKGSGGPADEKAWESGAIDLSRYLNEVARNASRMAERYAKLKQERPFRLKYNVSKCSSPCVEITGIAKPNAIISGDLAITSFTRKVRLSKDELQLLEDTIEIEIRTPQGKGGVATMSLIRK